ncbi:MAG: hypothetical protein RL662_2210 [Bacteroidota bacterium]|jgi:UDP-2,3-diacylglucosamine pyrophosphatase LpxH
MRLIYALVILSLFNCCTLSCTTKPQEKTLKLGVIADPHYLSEQLMDNGAAIKAYDKRSGKAIQEVPFVLEQVINDYLNSDIDVLLIPGDMTKDGEKESHTQFVEKLQPLLKKGVRIYVIPGNHDINMPNALGYKGNTTYPIETISPTDFTEIYTDFGYSDALERDPASLSYVAKLDNTTWLLAIDVCRYNEQTTTTISSGKLLPATEKWIEEVINKATKNNIRVVGMMHHGLVEHIMMQSTFFSDYIVDDWKRLASRFADWGMKAIFTGHFHANDITEYTSQAGNKIYDIETGSLAVYAFPYRFVELSKQGLKITTKNITSTPLSPQLATTNKAVMQERGKQLALEKIQARGMVLPDNVSSLIVNIISQIFVMHLEGDEKVDEALKSSIKDLSKELGSPMNTPSRFLEIDFYPADNNVVINFEGN